jgi:HEAT repeat protein
MPGTGGGRKTTPLSFEDWTFWYHNNKDDIENLKAALFKIRSTDNPIFGGSSDTGSRTSATRLTAKKVIDVIIPTLLWAMEPQNADHQDTESAAYLALAKLARDPAQISIIQRGLDHQLKRDQIVQESAALALGLLRRADKADQFTARDLDRVREFLFGVFEDDRYQARTRGFAVLAIGLLGDQPTGSGEYAGDEANAQKATTARLFELLKGKYANNDLYVGVLMAIGLQPATSVSQEMRDTLAECSLKGRLFRDKANNLVRSYAALALGRVGTAADIKQLESILKARRNMDDNIRRSAAIGLGLLGRLVSGEDRTKVAKVLLQTVEKAKDNSTRNFAIMSLAQLLIEDIRAGTTDIIGTDTDETPLERSQSGAYLQRPFGALAVGLVLREISEEIEIDAYQEFKEKGLMSLRAGITDTKLDNRGKAAFCTAVGIAGDGRSKEPLRQIVADTKADKELRGYAALGLGLIGEPTPEVTKAIADAMRERSSEELRRQTAVALGLLGNPKISGTGKDAVGLLLEELTRAKSQNHKGQIVISLARVGNHEAVDTLVAMVRNQNEQDLTRALACAGLGLIGDLELIPSLARLSKHVNYRASTDIVNEVLSIL